eukprot:comp24320_c0_seq5/m.45797 comp24320_c0_seq5/g.45797  ORF comp24320_c0_seq5/g.45797 comp24320_c0_seq5/m.45797 type:complete len:107 (-) comp24320_c0_seq5:300-620(-)
MQHRPLPDVLLVTFTVTNRSGHHLSTMLWQQVRPLGFLFRPRPSSSRMAFRCFCESKRPHIPVLLHECMDGLRAEAGGLFIDGTFGAGGHTQAILGPVWIHAWVAS